MPFVNEEKEMLAPVNPHMDSIQMVKTQKTKEHAMEELAKSVNKDVQDGKKKLDNVNPDLITGPSAIKKAKLKPPQPPKPKPPQEEEEEEEESKQDVDAKDLKKSADGNKNPKPPSVFDPKATKVGPDGKALEALNKDAGLDKDCSPLDQPFHLAISQESWVSPSLKYKYLADPVGYPRYHCLATLLQRKRNHVEKGCSVS